MMHTTPMQDLINYKTKEQHISYLLDKLQEESAECIQAVSKIRRFGINNKHPDRNTTNLQDLVNELEDLLAIVSALENLNYINMTASNNNIIQKRNVLLKQ
jgi:NTP pyrophosphatase (non-canonical NTP hydrolase)